MTFEERLAKYKKEDDYFAVDIWKSNYGVYETVHDLTWSEAKRMVKRALANKKVSRVDVVVEDWDCDDDYLFKDVESFKKKPFEFSVDLNTFKFEPIGWKWEGGE